MAHDSGLFKGIAISQIGVVVRDVRKMVEIYHKTLGWGPWSIYIAEPPLLHSTILRGKPVEFTFMNAETHVGKMGLEPLMSGAIGDTIKFYYLDSEPLLKIVLESGSGHMISIKPAFTYP